MSLSFLFRKYFTPVLFFVFLTTQISEAQPVSPKPSHSDLDQLVQKGMVDWKIPGMAVAIVKDGQVYYLKGFGQKKKGETDPVDENTLFGIASVSKHITASALSLLVDEGQLTWDDKISDIIPWFAFKDPWITREVTLRDALTHRVGIGRMIGNRLQFLSGRGPDELIYKLRFMDFEKPFRTSHVYSNMMYSVAGQVIEYKTGSAWGDFIQERLFKPMGMHSSTTSITQIAASSNAAWPHQEIEGEVVTIARRNWDNAAPAGAINSSVSDMAKWMIMQLGQPGVYEGKRYISEQQMAEMHKPQSIRPASQPYGSQNTYGLGWNILDYQGKRVLTHGGATDGFNTACYLVPELDLGVLVVGNTFNQLGDAVAYSVMDAFLGVQGNDWANQYFSNYQRNYQRAKGLRDEIHAARKTGTHPTLAETAYLGKFAHPAYDTVEIRKGARGLEIILWDNEEVVADLEHWHYDTYRMVWRNPAQREEFMSFSIGKNASVQALQIEFVLRPVLLQVGAYPSNYTREVEFKRIPLVFVTLDSCIKN